MKTLLTLVLILGIFIGFLAGFIIAQMMFPKIQYEYRNNLEGLFTKNSTGDWVCVDVTNMSPERAREVCNHEVGHEIFAEYCEHNFDKCLEVVK
jgi:hypothetical protein